jgi:hypothetical protein
MIDYIATLPLWLQIIIVIIMLLLLSGFIGSLVFRIIRYGIKIKLAKLEIDASEENEVKQCKE